MAKWISDLLDIIFPRHCLVCGDILAKDEEDLCLKCLIELPIIDDRQAAEIEKQFWGIIPVERATSYIHYRKGSPYNTLLHHLKYKNRPDIGIRLAQNAAIELQEKKFFDGIDIIIPLPLSTKKLRKRGYNQCDYIAKGISQVTNIPVITDNVIRNKANETQTHKTRDERWKNVEGIFSLTKPENLRGKHILLVDDVLTTGATITSCARTILESDCKISIFTIAYSSDSI